MRNHNLIRSLASLFFCIFLAFYFTSRNSTYENLQVTVMKKLKAPRFPNFWFGPIPKIENSEISESFLLFQSLTLVVTQDKKKKKWTETKTKKLRYGLRKNKKKGHFRGFWVFNYALYPKSTTRKSRKYVSYFKLWQ